MFDSDGFGSFETQRALRVYGPMAPDGTVYFTRPSAHAQLAVLVFSDFTRLPDFTRIFRVFEKFL